jgi:hypothetical protein
VKDARVDSRPPVATTATMVALPVPELHEEHAADRDRFEPKFDGRRASKSRPVDDRRPMLPEQITLPGLVQHLVCGTATSRAEVHVRQPLVRDPREATEALDSSARPRRNVRGGFGAGGLLG